MKKRLTALLLTVCILSLTGCGDATISTGNEKLADAVYNSTSVSLASYTGLKAEKKVYEVTQEALDDAIHEQLLEFAEYKSVDCSSEGNWVYTDYTAAIDGTISSQDEDYYFVLGEQEFGEQFDEHLTGVSVGDELNFSVDYDSDYSDSDWAGKTVDFSVSINKIEEEILPDCTDEFIRENMEYDSYSDFTSAVQASVAENYDSESTIELKEDLPQQVIDASSILQYTKEEYDSAYTEVENIYKSYADMFGTDLDGIYESFEITKDDLKEDAINTLYRTLIVNAIIDNEKITLSDEEYETGIAYYMEQYGYETREDFLNDYSEDEIRNQLLEDKVLELLLEHAEITEVAAEYEDE